MISNRGQYLAEMTRESLERGIVPAIRGRILDRNGHPLAWSTRQFDLSWKIPRNEEHAQLQLRQIQQQLALQTPTKAEVLESAGKEIVLGKDLAPEAVTAMEPLCRSLSSLRLQSSFIRHRHPAAQLRKTLGEVNIVNGIEVGISGAEKAHDAILRGHSGIYQVMRDKHGQWLPETWQKLRELRPGYDVYLPIRLPPASGDDS